MYTELRDGLKQAFVSVKKAVAGGHTQNENEYSGKTAIHGAEKVPAALLISGLLADDEFQPCSCHTGK